MQHAAEAACRATRKHGKLAPLELRSSATAAHAENEGVLIAAAIRRPQPSRWAAGWAASRGRRLPVRDLFLSGGQFYVIGILDR